MSYNILGINPFHNGSACVLSDGEVVYFLEEERLSRYKHDANPFRSILDILDRYRIDEVVIAGININDAVLNYSNEDPFYSLIRKFYPKLKVTSISDSHHLAHCFHTFFNSGFKQSLCFIIDSGGSFIQDKGIEMDSIFVNTLNNTNLIYSHYLNHNSNPNPKPLNIGASYSAISYYLDFKLSEEGKTMGLSSYGNFNSSLPNFFEGNSSKVDILNEQEDQNGIRKINFNPLPFNLPLNRNKSLHYSQLEKDLAWKIQNDTQQLVGDYIEKYTKKTGLKQVCCAGGYFLNCVTNYYLTKRFPDVEFYFEPISHDGGTAIGAAYWKWKQINPKFFPKKQKTLYYGPKYSKKELLEGIEKYI
jgi:carbamoyltransferase